MMQKSSKGSIAPTIRSSSAYLRLLKWKPPRRDEPPEARAQVVLAGVVRPVGQPEADDRRADLLGDLDAFAAVVEGAPAHLGVRMADAAEPVLVLAEEVRVDRPDPHALLLRVGAERGPVVDTTQGMWTATLGQTPVSRLTRPASAILSQTVRAAPGQG